MQEAVIFPEPQDVTILATRNGELTQIPGTEFRAPLQPFTAGIQYYWKPGDSKLNHSFIVKLPLNVQMRVHGMFNVNYFPTRYYLSGKVRETHLNYYNSSLITASPPSISEWRTFFNPGSERYTPSTNDQTPYAVLVEFYGYETVQTIAQTPTDTKDTTHSIYLPPTFGVMAWLETPNPMLPEDNWWGDE